MDNRPRPWSLIRWASEGILPHLTYLLQVFGRSRLRAIAPDTALVEVHDRGSSVTIISFAGHGALHGGMVNFEFTDLICKPGIEANLVFVRDPRCSCYHLSPDGGHDGLAYYATRIRSVLDKLGSKYHVAIGTSIGGTAATLFGHRLRMDQVIAFSPSWPPERYVLRRGLWARLRRLALLVTKPAVYVEHLALAQMARSTYKILEEELGGARIVDLERELEMADVRPQIALYYGDGCEPDVETAEAWSRVADAETVGLPTAMHNTVAYLRARKDLVAFIREHIYHAMSERGVARVNTFPPSVEAVSTLLAGAVSQTGVQRVSPYE